MDPGYDEATYSRTETIGMPNWSFVSLMASAKSICPIEQHDQTYDFLFQVVEFFLKERIEGVARALNIWAGLPASTDPGERPSIVPQGLNLKYTEVTFTTKETVGLPNKAKLEIFASSKKLANPGTELDQLFNAAASVQRQMTGKRDQVLANPRPWISS